MLYKHYKGGTYYTLDKATHTENGEVLVIYRSFDDESTTWARPYEMFHGFVELENGEQVKRFVEIEIEDETHDS